MELNINIPATADKLSLSGLQKCIDKNDKL